MFFKLKKVKKQVAFFFALVMVCTTLAPRLINALPFVDTVWDDPFVKPSWGQEAEDAAVNLQSKQALPITVRCLAQIRRLQSCFHLHGLPMLRRDLGT